MVGINKIARYVPSDANAVLSLRLSLSLSVCVALPRTLCDGESDKLNSDFIIGLVDLSCPGRSFVLSFFPRPPP